MKTVRIALVVLGVLAACAAFASTAAASSSRWVCIEGKSQAKGQRRFVCQSRTHEGGEQARQEPTITIEGNLSIAAAEHQAEADESHSDDDGQDGQAANGAEATEDGGSGIETALGFGVGGGVAEVVLGLLALF
jgi:hypothetical protein